MNTTNTDDLRRALKDVTDVLDIFGDLGDGQMDPAAWRAANAEAKIVAARAALAQPVAPTTKFDEKAEMKRFGEWAWKGVPGREPIGRMHGSDAAREAWLARAALDVAAPAAPSGVAPDQLTPLDYRAQGREEVLAIILAQDPENPFADETNSVFGGEDYSTEWDEDKLRVLLHIGDKKHDAYDRAEAAYWRAMGERDEAAREMLLVKQAPFYEPLHDFLAKHEAWDLMGNLKRAAADPALSGVAQPQAEQALTERDVLEILLEGDLSNAGADKLRSGGNVSFNLEELTSLANEARRGAAPAAPQEGSAVRAAEGEQT